MKGILFLLLVLFFITLEACPRGLEGPRGVSKIEENVDILEPYRQVDSTWQVTCDEEIVTSFTKLKTLLRQYLSSDAIGPKVLKEPVGQAVFHLRLPKIKFFRLQSIIKVRLPRCSLVETDRSESREDLFVIPNVSVKLEVQTRKSLLSLIKWMVRFIFTCEEI